MDKMQEITDYINTMKIKKSFFGGYDREDVYVKLGVITGMFQKYIEEFQKSEEKQKEEYEQRLQSSEKDIAQLQQRVGVLLSEKQSVLREKENALAEKATAIEAMDAAMEEKKENEAEKDLLKKKSDEQQERLGVQEEELARQQETIEELKEIQQRLEGDKDALRKTYKEYCSNVLQQYSDSLRTLSAEFSQILENVSNLQKAIVEAESMEIFDEKEKTEENMKILLDEKNE